MSALLGSSYCHWKLAFGYLRLEWKEIEVLSKLPRLEVLKLFDSMEGEEWEVSENVKFCKLICLRISSLNFKYWEASAYHFPRLERLLLHDCYQLTEIPNSFVEIPTLNLIELSSCLASAVMSAKQIQAEQHDWGNDDMVVIENDTI
nr:putative late blight resistance protein homolog R1B-14 [Ipomoea trifida]